jgi:glutamate synthase (NADPH/NADH) small chain
VSCLYRRSRAEAPARAEEIHHAGEEGVQFHWLVSPVEILDDGHRNVRAVRCVRMTLGEPDESGRRRPVPEPGSEFEIEADENLATAIPGVYAGGDIVTGAATVIEAMGAGRRAARSIKAFLGLRDTDVVYQGRPRDPAATLFGIDRAEHGFARVRLPR